MTDSCRFFFQAEDGIRDYKVTGVQTCALPIFVTGCLAERYREELRREIPEIDALLGTGEVPDILEAIGEPRTAGSQAGGVAIPDEDESAGPVRSAALPFYRKPPNQPAPGGEAASPRTPDRDARPAAAKLD